MKSEKEQFVLNVIVVILLSIAFIVSAVTAVIKFIELDWAEYSIVLFVIGLVMGISFLGALLFTFIAIDSVKNHN